MKILLIDTNNYTGRFFNAAGKDRTTELFLNFLKSAIRYFKVDAYCCCLDGIENYRKKIYSDYKSNREEKSQDWKDSDKNVLLNFDKLGIHHVKSKTLEAEDIINLMIKNHPIHEFIVLSGDKDCLLMYEHDNCLGVFDYKDKEFFERSFEKFGIADENKKDAAQKMLMYLSLKGDSGDNVPGVRGIGEKKIQMLMDKYKNVETLKKRLDKPNFLDAGCKEFEIVQKDKENFFLSEKLVRLFDEKRTTDLEKYRIKANRN